MLRHAEWKLWKAAGRSLPSEKSIPPYALRCRVRKECLNLEPLAVVHIVWFERPL